MSQADKQTAPRLIRREFLGLGLAALAGCTSPLIRGQSPELEDVAADEQNSVLLVGDYCGGAGLNYKRIESIGLVTQLDGTGSDPPPGQAREYLLGEMRGRDIKSPEKVLGSPNVSLVQVTAFLPPAVQKGDPIDVIVEVPKKSETTSLRGGWLMQARMRELANIGRRIAKGKEAGLAEGNITVDAIFNGDADRINEVRGRILGGGVSGETRWLGLVIRRDDVSIETTSVIGAAVNQRFHTFEYGSKKGVAEPKNDTMIKLLVPARYRANLQRYVAVVRSIPLSEAPHQRARRLEVLEQKLFEPTTCAKASLQLEAIGKEAIPALKKGLAARDLETRFHAAEALAYLDEAISAKALGEAAREVSAFRWSALAALSSLDHVSAYEALCELLHVSSAETRYGAFRALRMRNPNDPQVRGESLASQLSLHVIPTTGEPLVHISKAERSEIALFGHDIRLGSPQALYAGKHIMLTSPDSQQIKLSRFAPGEDDRVLFSSNSLEHVIRSITSLGGTYGDVVQAIHSAKKAGLLEARVAVDALPKPGRTYYRDDEPADSPDYAAELEGLMASSEDSTSTKGSDSGPAVEEEVSETYVDPKFTPATKKGVWSTVKSWVSWSE